MKFLQGSVARITRRPKTALGGGRTGRRYKAAGQTKDTRLVFARTAGTARLEMLTMGDLLL